MSRRDRMRAVLVTSKAAKAFDVGALADAEALYRDAIELSPRHRPALFDLGLLCKQQRRWQESLDWNLRALDVGADVREDPAFWNAGIASTALHDWSTARRMWRGYGLRIPDGDGELALDLGPTPVRINAWTIVRENGSSVADGEPEVIWGQRIDPARVIIENIPFPSSGHRWRDVVLHDGAPSGLREIDGVSRPVFDELERWAPSRFPTVQLTIGSTDADGLVELASALDAAGMRGEDWSTNVRWLCAACSAGDVRAGGHDHSAFAEGAPHLFACAGDADAVDEIVATWSRRADRVIDDVQRFD